MRTLFLTMLIVFASNLFAEPVPNKSNGQNNGLGAGGTVYKTWGFMYRRHFESGLGISTTFGGWMTRNSGHLGNELGALFTLKHHEFDWSFMPDASIRVYLAAYLANIYRRNYYDYHADVKASTSHAWEIGLGAGPGLEFFFNRYFGVHIELPWMTFVRIANKQMAFDSSYPHFGGGLVYYF